MKIASLFPSLIIFCSRHNKNHNPFFVLECGQRTCTHFSFVFLKKDALYCDLSCQQGFLTTVLIVNIAVVLVLVTLLTSVGTNCRLAPKVVTMVEQDLSQSGSFLARFVEAIHYYSALFDSLGASYGEDSNERHIVEQQLLSREIRNVLAVGGPARTGEVKFGNWREKLSQSGFRGVSLAGNAAAQATLLLGMFPSDGYTLVEENGTLKLGWKDLCLLTASAWKPIHSSPSAYLTTFTR